MPAAQKIFSLVIRRIVIIYVRRLLCVLNRLTLILLCIWILLYRLSLLHIVWIWLSIIDKLSITIAIIFRANNNSHNIDYCKDKTQRRPYVKVAVTSRGCISDQCRKYKQYHACNMCALALLFAVCTITIPPASIMIERKAPPVPPDSLLSSKAFETPAAHG